MKKGLRFLITNDDGIDAPGIAALTDIAEKISPRAEVWVVAPHAEHSGASQSFTMSVPVRLRELGKRRFSVSSTPSDCVVAAVQHLMKNNPPDFILSGINAGLNIGYDVNLSGTLGAAFAGLMYGVPSIALSMKRDAPDKMHWDTARALLPSVLRKLIETGWEKEHCVSINLPNLPRKKIAGVQWTRPTYGRMPPFDIRPADGPHRQKYLWIYPDNHPDNDKDPGSDDYAVRNGFISMSILSLQRGHIIPPSSPSSK